MGSGYNMPDGVYESDIPGYFLVEEDGEATCDNCERDFTFLIVYDSKWDKTYDVVCDKAEGGCGHKWKELTPAEAHRQELAEMYADDEYERRRY